MSFLSIKFVVFFLIVLLVYQALHKRVKYQKIWLLTVSYIFYGFFDVKYLLILIGITLWTWVFGVILVQNKRKIILLVGIIGQVTVLVVFKYFNFFIDRINELVGADMALKIIMPVGLSFYVFQAISYIIDLYKGKIGKTSMLDLCLYIGFFPQLVSGPIIKVYDFLPQLQSAHSVEWNRVVIGFQRFLLGVFEKIVIADRLGIAVDSVYLAPNAYSGVSLAVTSLSYTMQIYFDFAGYSNMAIAIAYILGFDYADNFNMPYLAKNPSDFWGRWHISLSSWLKEYVYFSLGGNRKGRARTYFNLFLTMLVSGLWHGSSLTFLVWGGLHGLALIVHKMYIESGLKCRAGKLTEIFSIIMNFCFVSLLWIPFRLESMTDTFTVFKRIFTCAKGVNYIYVYTVIFAIGLLMVQVYSYVKTDTNNPWKPLDFNKFTHKVYFCIFILFIIVFAYIGNGAFIYGQF